MYNCAAYIGECVTSLQRQTMKNFEVICVDDGSTDDTLAQARKAAQGDERFIFDTLPQNKGQSVARNVALEKALGDYIVLLDADDYLVDEALEKLIMRATDQQLDELYFSARSFYESFDSHKLVQEDYRQRTSFDEVVTGQELFAFFQMNQQFFPQAAFRMVKRDLLETHHIRFFEGIIHEDLLFSFRVLSVSKRSSFLNEELYQRRIREGSTMTINSKNSLQSVRGHFVCVTEMKKWLDDHVDALETNFIPAITESLSEFALKASFDWHGNTDDVEKTAYLDTLSPREKLLFYEEVVHPGSAVIKVKNEYLESKTYQLGDAILRVPRSIRNGLKDRSSYKKQS